MNKPIKVRLHVLSPVHIGCDDVYEPTSFVIDEQKNKLIEFDPMEFVKSLKPQEAAEFSKTAAGDNLLAIFKMIKRFYKPAVKGREVGITTHLVSHYKKILSLSAFDKKAVINQFTMNKTAYNPHTNQPYIPGSSLKGALRTAYLTSLAVDTETEKFWVECGLLSNQDLENPSLTYNQIGRKRIVKELEKKLLKGDFDTDPFRMVKVSDLLPVENVKTKIVYAINKKKKKSDKESLADKGGAYQIFETIQAGEIFEGIINIDTPEKISGIQNPIDTKLLLSSAHKFYADNLKQEMTPLNEALGLKHIAGITANDKFKDSFTKTAFLIRLGRHSGAEAVTIEGNRNIKIMQGGDKKIYLDHATTFWLASDTPRPNNNNGLLPFGWAVLEIVEFDIRKGIYPDRKPPEQNPLPQEIKQITSPVEPPEKQATAMTPETVIWENATLTWTPGNQILKATKDNYKAELKVKDKSTVPEQYHEELFTKKKSVTANVKVEKIGNLFKISEVL